MEIIVCIKRVPDVAEMEVEVDSSGHRIEERDLVYGINEWDNFAIEAAVSLKETHGGRVTVLTVGGEDDEEVLRRALAMGAAQGMAVMPGLSRSGLTIAGSCRPRRWWAPHSW